MIFFGVYRVPGRFSGCLARFSRSTDQSARRPSALPSPPRQSSTCTSMAGMASDEIRRIRIVAKTLSEKRRREYLGIKLYEQVALKRAGYDTDAVQSYIIDTLLTGGDI